MKDMFETVNEFGHLSILTHGHSIGHLRTN